MFRVMDEAELEILYISDIKMIHFYRLSDALPAVAIIYGDNRQINYCQSDKYYELYIKTILKCVEKQGGVENISMDSQTRAVFDTFEESVKSPEDERFSIFDENGLDIPVYYPQSYSDKLYIPIAKYLISELYGMFEKTLVWKRHMRVWHGKGNLIGIRGEREVNFPFSINNISNNEVNIKIGNFLDNGGMLDIDICFEADGITLLFESDVSQISGVSTYRLDLKTGEMTENTTISSDGYMIYSNNEVVPMATNEYKENMIKELSAAGIYDYLKKDLENARLIMYPWKQYAAINVDDRNEDDVDQYKLTSTYITADSQFVVSKSYHQTRVRDSKSGVTLDTESYTSEIFADVRKNNTIQVFFEDRALRVSGKLESKLKDKFFIFKGKIPT